MLVHFAVPEGSEGAETDEKLVALFLQEVDKFLACLSERAIACPGVGGRLKEAQRTDHSVAKGVDLPLDSLTPLLANLLSQRGQAVAEGGDTTLFLRLDERGFVLFVFQQL